MEYLVIGKILGGYLPENLKLENCRISKKSFHDKPDFLSLPLINSSSTQHCADAKIRNYYQFPNYQISINNFESEYVFEMSINSEKGPEHVSNQALKKIANITESLSVMAIGYTTKDLLYNYNFQIVGVYLENGAGDLVRLKLSDSAEARIYRPEELTHSMISDLHFIMQCSDPTLKKVMEYLATSKRYSCEYFARIEVYMSLLKCIELICLSFYGTDYMLWNSKGRKKVRMGLKAKIVDVCAIMNIDSDYEDYAISAWDNRNNFDIAHASVQNTVQPIRGEINRLHETVYVFVNAFIRHLKDHPNL